MGFQMNEEEILASAARQFQKSGLKFTMLDVANDLHIAKKTIYQFYSGKEELLTAMLDTGFARIHARKKEILDQDISIPEKIQQVMIAMPDSFEVIDFRQLSDLKEKYPKVYARLRRHLETDWEPVINEIQKGIDAGVVRNISIPVLRTMVTASFETFLSTNVLKSEGIQYNDALNQMMDIIMNGIAEDKK